jgi:hypothetical protein
MIDIGITDFLINVPSLPREEFEDYSTKLFDEWEKCVEQTLILPDYSISLEVEEGSTKGAGKIAVAAGALYFGIGNYGDFISGLQTIGSQVSYVSNALFVSARSPFGCSNVNAKVRKRGGALSHLHKLFDEVQGGKITSDQAMIEVERLFGEDESSNELISELRSQFGIVPLHPEQLSLHDGTWEECNPISTGSKKGAPRSSRRKPDPLSQHYRIEIWRESKKDKKSVRVTKLKS